MTIDKRIEFLIPSIESHDRQIAKLVENGAKVDARLDSPTVNMEKFREMTQLDFDRLAQPMMGLTDHIVDHQRRINDLEGGRS